MIGFLISNQNKFNENLFKQESKFLKFLSNKNPFILRILFNTTKVTNKKKMEKKKNTILMFNSYVKNYDTILLLNYDKVGSKQFQHLRKSLNNNSVILNGKVAVFRKAIEMNEEKNLKKIIPHLKNHVCFLFTNESYFTISKLIEETYDFRTAEIGDIPKEDVIVYPHETGLDPSNVCHMTVNGIHMRIRRGLIEIVNQVTIVDAGEKLKYHQASLMKELGMKLKTQFEIELIYQKGNIYPIDILECQDDYIHNLLLESIKNIAVVSLETNYSNITSFNYEITSCLNNILAISIDTEYKIPEVESIEDFIKNPSTYNYIEEYSSPESSDTDGISMNEWILDFFSE